MTGKEQCSFHQGKSSAVQIFTLRYFSEKTGEKGKQFDLNFMDLEKAHDRINKKEVWITMGMAVVGAKNLRGSKEFI